MTLLEIKWRLRKGPLRYCRGLLNAINVINIILYRLVNIIYNIYKRVYIAPYRNMKSAIYRVFAFMVFKYGAPSQNSKIQMITKKQNKLTRYITYED